MTSAASAVLVLFDRAALSTKVFIFGFEVIRMATGAGWCVYKLIRIIVTIDTATYRSFMAAITARVFSVIAGVISVTVMAKAGWYPAVCGVTHVALFRRV